MKPQTKSLSWRMGVAALALMASSSLTLPSFAEDFIVEMKTKGEAGSLVFEPAILKIVPGDTVIFKPDAKIHNVQSMKAMIPEGGSEWKGKFGEEVSVTFDVEGVYGYRCAPHYFAGMVGLIVVGDPSLNVEQAKAAKHMGSANQKFQTLFDQL